MLGKLIKTRRREKRLTQKQLANKLGWSSGQFISNLERNLVSVPVPQIKKLAKVLSIDAHVLVKAQAKFYANRLAEVIK